MLQRYTRAEMGRIWSEEARLARWLEIELALTDVLAERGEIPAAAARKLRTGARVDPARMRAIEDEVKHDVVAFVSAVAETVGDEGRFLHLGLTSSDVVDTAFALQLRDAADLLLAGLDRLRQATRVQAERHRHTLMIGRTHGIHAEPITFGLKCASWWAELGRDRRRLAAARKGIAYGKLSGAVGTFAHLPPEIEADVCRRLHLEPAAVSSQVIQRDRHAELLTMLAITAASLEKLAVEIRGLQRTEIAEVEEPFAQGQKGSSAMPHKRNPIGCEQICGLARLVRANAHASLENVALWHERDISHSSVERVILPDSFIALDHMLRRFTEIVKGMAVNADRMRKNLESTKGLVFSGQLLLELTARGMRREDAYRVVQGHAMEAWKTDGDFRRRVSEDPEVKKVLSAAELAEVFRLERYLGHVDTVFRRVFPAAPAGAKRAGRH